MQKKTANAAGLLPNAFIRLQAIDPCHRQISRPEIHYCSCRTGQLSCPYGPMYNFYKLYKL